MHTCEPGRAGAGIAAVFGFRFGAGAAVVTGLRSTDARGRQLAALEVDVVDSGELGDSAFGLNVERECDAVYSDVVDAANET